MTTKGYCPSCRKELPQEYLSSPIMACPRCHRIIHFPDFRAPNPKVFDRFDRAARRMVALAHREWSMAGPKRRAEIEKKLQGLALVLENS